MKKDKSAESEMETVYWKPPGTLYVPGCDSLSVVKYSIITPPHVPLPSILVIRNTINLTPVD